MSHAETSLAVALELMGQRQAIYGPRTFRHDNPGLVVDPADKPRREFYSARREYGGKLARFQNVVPAGPIERKGASLDPRHPALKAGRSIFPSRVFDANERGHVLVSGINNAKLGKRVTKGAWRGFPIFMLSLEERATCPRACPVFDACYGNALPGAVRFHYTPSLMVRLGDELAALHVKFARPHHLQKARGFVVRLHTLGDFPDLDYLQRWAKWSDQFDTLHVWGYTAHPVDSVIGDRIALMNFMRPDRWQIRFSVAPGERKMRMQTAAVWKGSPVPAEGEIICPQEQGKTATCGTCALCWNPNMAATRVLFMGHGMGGGRHD